MQNYTITHTQLTIDGVTVTLDQYRALPTREARSAFADAFIRRLSDLFREKEEILKQIRDDAWAAFKEQTAGVPCELPTHFTKTGKPDRRFRGKPNPAYHRPAQVRDQVIAELSSRVAPISATFRWPYQFCDVFSTWEKHVETPWERFRRLLAGMDWYSHYSDDHSVWARGEAHMGEVRSLMKQLGPEAELEFNRACPWLNEDGTHKKDAA